MLHSHKKKKKHKTKIPDHLEHSPKRSMHIGNAQTSETEWKAYNCKSDLHRIQDHYHYVYGIWIIYSGMNQGFSSVWTTLLTKYYSTSMH